jgi:hypothetical protein
VGAEPTSSGSVELRDYPAVLRRRLAQSEPAAAAAAKVAADHRHPAQLLEHVQVDVAANSQILRVRYRYRPQACPSAVRAGRALPPSPCWWSSTSTWSPTPRTPWPQIPAFLELEGDIPSDGIDTTRRSATYEGQGATLPRARLG